PVAFSPLCPSVLFLFTLPTHSFSLSCGFPSFFSLSLSFSLPLSLYSSVSLPLSSPLHVSSSLSSSPPSSSLFSSSSSLFSSPLLSLPPQEDFVGDAKLNPLSSYLLPLALVTFFFFSSLFTSLSRSSLYSY